MNMQKVPCCKENCFSAERHSAGSICFILISSLSLILILGKSGVAIEYMKEGLDICSHTVVPSLFPFMIISELIISSGAIQKISILLSPISRMLFGISSNGGCAYILGLLCGFPIGTKSAVSMYEKGMISKKELEHLITFANNPSSAFIINAVGISLFSEKRLGFMLYACIVLSSVAVGIIGRFLFFSKEERNSQINNSYISDAKKKHGILLFTSAVKSSANSMLYVCAYIVFFSAFVGCLGALLADFGISETANTIIFGFFELTSGVGHAAVFPDRFTAILLCAFFSGWSGLSVHFQIMSICSECKISFKKYFAAKFLQGVLCVIFILIFAVIFGL